LEHGHETNLAGHETIFGLRRRHPETAVGYQPPNDRRTAPLTRRRQMRTLSFILAFAFILAGPSMAGSSDTSLPGIGTFTYNAAPVAAPQLTVVASR
jgi:hypothetical protein